MTSSAKGPGGRAEAHGGLGLAGEAAQGGRRRGPSGGSAWSSQRDPMQGVSGLLITTGLLVVFLWRCYGGQEGRGATGGEESRVWSNSPAAVLG
jgi:hypothetical protein